MYELSFTEKVNNLKNIDSKEVGESIDEEKASAFLGLHALTGSHFTSKFNGKSKATRWKIFNKSDELVQRAFSNFGETDDLPLADTEKFLRTYLALKVSI